MTQDIHVLKKAVLKFKNKHQHCIYFNEAAGQKIIKNLKTINFRNNWEWQIYFTVYILQTEPWLKLNSL